MGWFLLGDVTWTSIEISALLLRFLDTVNVIFKFNILTEIVEILLCSSRDYNSLENGMYSILYDMQCQIRYNFVIKQSVEK